MEKQQLGNLSFEELQKMPHLHSRRMLIDTSFDFRTDASGKDPDAYSPTLRLYHKLLWSKALPSGRLFDLDDTVRRVYLHHSSELGEFFLCSAISRSSVSAGLASLAKTLTHYFGWK